MLVPSESHVHEAAQAIVSAFAATDTERYFAGFAPEASFIFHVEEQRLNTRAEYETLWASWLADDWKVVSCTSSEPLVQVFPGGAIFSHTVETEVSVAGEHEAYTERETIVFRTTEAGELIAIHEHLSATPELADENEESK